MLTNSLHNIVIKAMFIIIVWLSIFAELLAWRGQSNVPSTTLVVWRAAGEALAWPCDTPRERIRDTKKRTSIITQSLLVDAQ